MPKNYKELRVWQKAMELVLSVYRMTSHFPDSEKFGLVNQMRRAAVSVASNIAEGHGRLSSGEFRPFLSHARGSLNEVSTQAFISLKFNLISEREHKEVDDLVTEICRLKNSLIKALSEQRCKETESSYGYEEPTITS